MPPPRSSQPPPDPDPEQVPPGAANQPAEPGATERVDRSVLGHLERLAIARLTVTMPSTVIDPNGAPTPMLMLDFRERLMRGNTAQEIKDHAWRHLGELARHHRGEWNLFALGTGYPGLRDTVTRLTANRTYWQERQIHFAIAVEFLFALHRLDLTTPHVFNRLVDAAYTHASGRKRRPREQTYGLDRPIPATSIYDDPETYVEAHLTSVRAALDAVIAQANASPGRQRITEIQAALIARTYLDGQRLREVAAELHLSEPSASKQRRRAVNVIARTLGRPDLADPPRPRTPPDETAGTTAEVG
jgi:hypothetical protein